MLLSVKAPVFAPPVTPNVSPSCLLILTLSSPLKLKPLAILLVLFVILVVLISCCSLEARFVNLTCLGLEPSASATVNVMLPSAATLYSPLLPAAGFAIKR